MNISVKKFSKKSLSLLIALIMVFSALPLTPPVSAEAATEAELQSLRNEVTLTKVNNLQPEKFNANGYFVNDVATGGFDNLLYCSKEVQYGDQAWNDTVQFRPDIPTYVVMAYDGASNVGFPIVGEVKKSGYSPRVEYFGITNTNDFELRHLWYGYLSNDWTHWPNKNSSNYNEDFGWDASNVNTYSPGTTTTYFNNEIYYKGTGNYTEFYDFFDGTIKFLGKKNNYNAVTFGNTGAKQYVLNYKPIYDIISGKSTNLVMLPTSTGYTNSSMTFKGLFEYINNNPNRFTVDSQVEYYKAVRTICNMKVAGEFAFTDDSTVDANVKAAANVIKNAYNNYNTAVANLVRQYEVKFVSNDNTENIKYYPVDTTSSSIVIPENTANNYDNAKHYSYSWPSVQNVTKDVTYKEVETMTEHSYSNKGISDDKAKVQCSCGHYYELDYSVYKAELIVLKDKLADTARYTTSSIEDATKAMNAVIAKERQPLTQDEVTVLVSDLIDAENSLVVKTFTLTFNVYLGEDKKELKHTEKLNNVPYGESNVLTIPSGYQTDYAVTKWTRTIKSSDSIIGTTTSSLTIIANSDASYNVFIKSTADPVDTKMVTATLNNKSNKVVDVAYVKKGTSTVSIKNSSITLTNGDSKTTLTAPSYSFYNVSGFTVNDLPVSDGSSVEINDTTVIRPIYDVKDRFTVLLDTNVKTNKGETGSVEKGWDERITVTADDANENTQWLYQYKKSDGLYSEAEVIGYGKTVSLQVTQSCKISYKNGQTAQPQVSMDYVSYNVYKPKTITAVGRYYLPENCTKVRAGVILKTSNQKKGATNKPSWVDLSNKDNYKITNKSGVFEATSFVNGTNQYAINFYSSSDYQTMYIGAVAYLTYTDGTNEYTIYSDIARYEYNASVE